MPSPSTKPWASTASCSCCSPPAPTRWRSSPSPGTWPRAARCCARWTSRPQLLPGSRRRRGRRFRCGGGCRRRHPPARPTVPTRTSAGPAGRAERPTSSVSRTARATAPASGRPPTAACATAPNAAFPPAVAVALTVLGAAIHAAGVITRALGAGRVPWGNMYEFLTTGRVRGGGRVPAGADPPRPALPGHVRDRPGHHHAGGRLRGVLDPGRPPGAGPAELLAAHPRVHRRDVLGAVHPDLRHVRAAAASSRTGRRPSPPAAPTSWASCASCRRP